MSQSIANADAGATRIQHQQIVWWVQLIVVLGALLTAAGAAIALIHPAMLASPHDEINGAVRVFAGYFAARNLGLSAALLLLLAMRAKRALGKLLVLVGVIQLIDTCIDCFEGRWPVVPGVLVLGVVFLLAASKLCGGPLWNRRTWGE
jgi:hypothetical protein